jgi:RNA polymerase sigma factor (sigma-70 family)
VTNQGRAGASIHYIRSLFSGGTLGNLGEGDLLDRFLTDRDEVAFEELLSRHGPMVLGVCRRWLSDPDEIDDAFQATFLILVRKARSLRRRNQVGPWLHGVAYRVARRARAHSARRRSTAHLTVASEPAAPENGSGPERSELGSILDQEIARLPEGHRRNAFGCHSAAGCRFVERMLTVVQTLRLQNRPVLDYVHRASVAHRAGLPAPQLLSQAGH